MQNSKINKDELLAVLRKNLTKHTKLVAEAKANHRKKSILWLAANLALAKAGKKFSTHSRLIEPADYTDKYLDVIKRLEMSIDKIVELDEGDFARYILDRWEWKGVFDSSNSVYFSKKSR